MHDLATGRTRPLGHGVNDLTADGELAVLGSGLTFLVAGDTNRHAEVLLERLR